MRLVDHHLCWCGGVPVKPFKNKMLYNDQNFRKCIVTSDHSISFISIIIHMLLNFHRLFSLHSNGNFLGSKIEKYRKYDFQGIMQDYCFAASLLGRQTYIL